MDDKRISSELIYRLVDIFVILMPLILGGLYTNFYNAQGYLVAGLSAVVLFGLYGRFTEIYTSWGGRPIHDEAGRIVVAWLLTFLSMVFIAFISKTSEQFSRVVLLAWLLATPVVLILARLALRQFFSHLKRLGLNNRSVAIVGMTENGLRFARELENNPDFGYRIAGFYDERQSESPSDFGGYANLGTYPEMINSARQGEWDQIYFALPVEAKKRMHSLLDELADSATPIRLLPDYFTTNLLHSKFIEIADTPVLCIYDSPFSSDHALVKRIEDVMIGGAILALISPVLLGISLAVKLTSKGAPAIFKQTRYGLKGEKILVWKFRTMNVCEDGDNVRQAQKNDDRFTPIGRFLRRTSLDELPQFINVLQGRMSIVGPRPHAVAHNEQYRSLIPGYMLRHMIKPGITGWAQINGWRGETNTVYKMKKRVEFDLEYMREWSLALDLKIIFLTITRSFIDKNAY